MLTQLELVQRDDWTKIICNVDMQQNIPLSLDTVTHDLCIGALGYMHSAN